jgi:hypothetical protein
VASMPDGKQLAPANASTAKPAAGVEQILQMVHAGVSKEVIKAYIESAPIAYELSAADIIALKNEGVPDELTTAIIKRGAELRTEVAQANAAQAARLGSPRRYGSYRGLDPEGYDYFQYYYLYPRTLAAANQRLYSSSSTFTPYPAFGFYGPSPFNPMPPYAFRRP